MDVKQVAIVHYNTPELTEAGILSLRKHGGAEWPVTIFDNSDRKPFYAGQGSALTNTEIIDNTRGQVIDWPTFLGQFTRREWSDNNYGSAKHCYSVQWLMDHLDTPFILMDSDVLISQDITPLWDETKAWVGKVGCNTRRRFGFEVFRLEPFLCFLNTPMIKAHGVRYFNPKRMWCLVDQPPYNRYDTGAWFLEDCNRRALPHREFDVTTACVHFRHASWKKKDATAWLKQHENLWK